MRDEVILRLLEDACKGLKDVSFPVQTPHLAPVYNALLAAARANHPNEPFFQALTPIERRDDAYEEEDENEEARGGGRMDRSRHRRGRGEDVSVAPEELRVLMGQLRIALESFRQQQPSMPSEASRLDR